MNIKTKSITITMTVEQFDTLRYAARVVAKKHRKHAIKGLPAYSVRHNLRADELERVTAIVSNAMRREMGEQDFNVLELGNANPAADGQYVNK